MFKQPLVARESESDVGDCYAVLCGISDYEYDSGFPDLDYCDDDLIVLNRALQEASNWKSENMNTFVDEDASKEVILSEVENIFNRMNESAFFLLPSAFSSRAFNSRTKLAATQHLDRKNRFYTEVTKGTEDSKGRAACPQRVENG